MLPVADFVYYPYGKYREKKNHQLEKNRKSTFWEGHLSSLLLLDQLYYIAVGDYLDKLSE